MLFFDGGGKIAPYTIGKVRDSFAVIDFRIWRRTEQRIAFGIKEY